MIAHANAVLHLRAENFPDVGVRVGLRSVLYCCWGMRRHRGFGPRWCNRLTSYRLGKQGNMIIVPACFGCVVCLLACVRAHLLARWCGRSVGQLLGLLVNVVQRAQFVVSVVPCSADWFAYWSIRLYVCVYFLDRFVFSSDDSGAKITLHSTGAGCRS